MLLPWPLFHSLHWPIYPHNTPASLLVLQRPQTHTSIPEIEQDRVLLPKPNHHRSLSKVVCRAYKRAGFSGGISRICLRPRIYLKKSFSELNFTFFSKFPWPFNPGTTVQPQILLEGQTTCKYWTLIPLITITWPISHTDRDYIKTRNLKLFHLKFPSSKFLSLFYVGT